MLWCRLSVRFEVRIAHVCPGEMSGAGPTRRIGGSACSSAEARSTPRRHMLFLMAIERLRVGGTRLCHSARNGLQHLQRASRRMGIPCAAIAMPKCIISRSYIPRIFEEPFSRAVELAWSWEGGDQVMVDRVLVGMDLFEGIAPGDVDVSFGISRFRDDAQGVEDVEGVFEAVDG